MTKKRKLTIFIIIIVVIAGLLIAWVLSDSNYIESEPVELKLNTNTNQQTKTQTQSTATQPEPQIIDERTPAELQLYGTARNFAERYASFSTDSGFTNLEEVKIFSTSNMILELDKIIDDGNQSDEFYGVTSKVLKVDIVEMGESQGQVVVTLQRQESKLDKADFVFYQDLELFLVKIQNNWLVDQANWLN